MSDFVSTGFPRVDRVLGGGLRRGSFHMLTGPMGVGKSAFMAQVACAVNAVEGQVALFVSADQSLDDLIRFLERHKIPLDRGAIACERDWQEIAAMARPTVLLVDMLESVTDSAVDVLGDARTEREYLAMSMKRFAAQNDLAVLASAHTESTDFVRVLGDVRGILQAYHAADVTLSLSYPPSRPRPEGDRELRCEKNRFIASGTSVPLQFWGGKFYDAGTLERHAWTFFSAVASVFLPDNDRLFRLWQARAVAHDAWVEAGGCEVCGGTQLTPTGDCVREHSAGLDPLLASVHDLARKTMWGISGRMSPVEPPYHAHLLTDEQIRDTVESMRTQGVDLFGESWRGGNDGEEG